MRWGIILMVLAGCLDAPPPFVRTDAGVDAGSTFSVVAVSVSTLVGEVRTLANSPRRLEVRVELSEPAENADFAILLLRGEADDALVQDFEVSPLRAETLARDVPCTRESRGTKIVLTPMSPADAGEHLLVVIAPWLKSAAHVALDGDVRTYPIHISTQAGDGAVLVESWPADGTSDVPLTLPFAALRFDGELSNIQEGITLSTQGGTHVDTIRRETACNEIGFQHGVCVVLQPTNELVPGATYALAIGDALRDGTGAPFEPAQIQFSAARDRDTVPLHFAPPPCAIDESSGPLGCLLVDDAQAILRTRASGPARAWLTLGMLRDNVVSTRGDMELRLFPLPPAAFVNAELRFVDLGGASQSASLPFTTTAPLASLSITEIRPDPVGPEPQQEYVEVLNYGDVGVDMLGFSLSDRADSLGDVITSSQRVAPHSYVLLVPDSFNAESTEDTQVPPGVPLIRIGTSIGSAGITNRGEPLYLRDESMRRISAAPALAVSRAGACITRVSESMRDGSSGAFAEDPRHTCTPGDSTEPGSR